MTRKRILYGLIVTALLIAVIPAAAAAQTSQVRPTADERIATEVTETDRLERAKARVIRQIERRLATLDRLTDRIESGKYLTEAHAVSLLEDIAAAREILRAGIPAVEAATTPEELRAAAPPIFENTLVRALLVPKTYQVVASDATAAASDRFAKFGAALQKAIDRITEETDIDTAEAQAKLDEMLRLVNQGGVTGGAVADAVIDLQPTDWPDPARGALREGRAALGAARDSFREARAAPLGQDPASLLVAGR